MKKLFLLSSLFFIISSFGYTSEDVSNANYLAEQGIITKDLNAPQYNYRLDDKIIRQEVIGMALKIKWVTLPENYTCKKYFADVTKNDWVCRAIELAADNGIITRSNRYANPIKDVTRAEALAMLMKAGNMTTTVYSGGPYPFTDIHKNSWQYNLIGTAFKSLIISGPSCDLSQSARACAGISYGSFYPNRLATRAEVFGFTKNITAASLPKLPEFWAGPVEVLPKQLSCVKTEIEVWLGDPLCESDYYKKNATAYTLFLAALRAKDNEKIVQYGTTLGAYNYGFSETKYRIFGDSFIGMTFGPQSWGSISFLVYTLRGDTIVHQIFSNSDTDYRDWENAVVKKYNLKSLDELFRNDTIKIDSEKYKEILAFANQYWYDRFEKMEIK